MTSATSPFELPLGSRVRAGASYGLVMGAVFAGVALLNALLHGGQVVLRGGRGVALWAVLVAYLGFGPLTGALFGALFPLMRRAPAAYAVGTLVSAPMLAFFSATLGRLTLGFVLPAMLVLGGVGGLIVRGITTDDAPSGGAPGGAT